MEGDLTLFETLTGCVKWQAFMFLISSHETLNETLISPVIFSSSRKINIKTDRIIYVTNTYYMFKIKLLKSNFTGSHLEKP